MIAVHIAGRHSRRTPLSYPALAGLWRGALRHEAEPARSDLILYAHAADLAAPAPEVVRAWRGRRMPVLLFSEEPFWDSLFSGDPLARDPLVETAAGMLPVRQINHHTSAVFRFDRLPYYLLTDHSFAPAYAARFRRNARRSAAEWKADLAARPLDAVFMAERRLARLHDVVFPEGDLVGLCAWRTRLALTARGRIERLGASWGGGRPRAELTHWHLDKLIRLDGCARVMSAVENTHQPTYVSEKIFDAFACGSLPLYLASPGHRLHRIGLPEGSWLNLWGLSPEAAAERLGAAVEAPGTAGWIEPFRAAQVVLARLMDAPETWAAERARLRGAVLAELELALEG